MKKQQMKYLNEIKKDKLFKSRMSNEINQIIDLEMAKPDNEIDWELIDECTDSLLFLNNMENETLKITPFLIKKYRTKYTFIKIFKATSYVAAVIALVLVAGSIVSNQSQPNIASEIESTSTTAQFVQSIEEQETTIPVETTAENAIELTSTTVASAEQPTKAIQNSVHSVTKESTTKKPSGVISNKTTEKADEATTHKEVSTQPTTQHRDNNETTTKPEVQTTAPTTVVIESEKELASISGEFGKGFKKVYFVGEELDLFGLTVVAHYEDGSTKIINNAKCSFNGFSSNSAGNKTVIVSYEGKSFAFNVSVINKG